MKKIYIVIATLVFSVSFAQINLLTNPDLATLPNSNSAFLDASSSYDNGFVGNNNIGKGLVFPQVDLTTFEFDTTTPDGAAILPTFYDGMIVYNTVDGKTITDVAKGGIQVDVKKGFYYFFNPEGRTNLNVNEGKWIRLGDDGIANFWSLNGNTGTTEAVIDPSNYAIKSGNFIGTKDNKKVTMGTNNVARLSIGEISENVGGEDFDFVLKVYGKARFTDGIVTNLSTYPDYVFDNYFTGKSEENPNYKFKSLNEVESFIKENNHLPGVTSIKDLEKSEEGYYVDNSKLSIQTLEKVEELYLHMIEQQKEIKALKAEIAELKK